MARKYPLETLRRLRAERAEQKARTLADALRAVDASREELARRKRQKDAFETECARTEEAEHGRLERGALTAADLMQGAAFRVGADVEKACRADRVDKARAGVGQAQAEADRRREGVARARADADVVEKNHQRWQIGRRVEREKAEEEGAEEAFSGRGRPTRGRR